ncbi:expressed unknown protein [Seminavis robusta]|uniref:Hint domain-containing protein n=1 Tax=Seminavis robusta TaxID=568900 RepID=A0A9N8D7I7_9STRA|nr:expressed unknown protein [Seminavis robusta]|eukprot:Sro7_g006341.1  (412) ;mRNA; f:244022-245257
MKIVSPFGNIVTTGIITTLLMATSCSASVCLTLNVPDDSSFFKGSTSPPAGATDVVCDVTCTSATNLRILLEPTPGTIGDSTFSCGTTLSYTTSSSVEIKHLADANTGMVITCNCLDLSTPVPVPTSAPAPTPPASACFSKQATVTTLHVEQPQTTKMVELKIGDMVLTANNRYQPIYAFAHNDATTATKFLQIHNTNNKNPLEATGQHLVYVQGEDAPVTAKSIKVGDTLPQAQAGHGQGGAAIVTKIDTVQRHGIYAPLTQDGTLVVDGIASSCYISLQPNGNPKTMELQGHSTSMLSHHNVAHMLMTLPRLVCMGGINPRMCQTYNNNGVALFVQMAFDLAHWFHAQHWVVQIFLLAVYLVVLCPLYALELLFGAKLAAAMVVGGLVLVGFVRGNAPAVDPVDVKKEA